jgi:hypothetical protein
VFESTFTAATTKAYNITSIRGDQASEKIERGRSQQIATGVVAFVRVRSWHLHPPHISS